MRVDWTDRDAIEAYRKRLLLALENADYLSPTQAIQDALFKCHKALGQFEIGAALRDKRERGTSDE